MKVDRHGKAKILSQAEIQLDSGFDNKPIPRPIDLKRRDIATIVEHYPMPEGEEDGYSLEGFDVPQVTLEVAASQIIPIAQWHQEEMILRKLRQLSKSRRLQLEDYLDFLLQKEQSENVSA